MRSPRIFFLFIFIIFLLTKVNFVSALEVKYPDVLGLTITESSTFPDYAKYFFNLGMAIAGTLAILVIVIGGLYYLISFGSGKITNEGKEWIKAGLMGLLLIFSSYVIAVTINPQLRYFNIENLIPFGLMGNPPGNNTPPGPPTVIYQEIPIGTLTENLLTRTTNCYDFDFRGDPIDGDPNTPGWEPTFMDHDRVDCMSKLSEAIEKKAKIFSDLSEEIAKLMDTCICKEPPCSLNCTPPCEYTACDDSTLWAVGTNLMCQGDCVKASCKGGDCCEPETRAKIEHGLIPIKSCKDDPGKDYKGLDEYRTDKTTILPTMEEEIDLNNKKVKVIKKDEWEKAKLIEQLMYLKEKLAQFKDEIQNDLDLLKSAETKVNGCYTVKTYIDFIKLLETTNKKDKIILSQKTFKDPVTQKDIDIAKYCKGFGYSDASRFNTCKKICAPGANQASFEAIKGCGDDTDCIQTEYYKCGANDLGFDYFQDCLEKMGEECEKDCEKKYPACPDLIKQCKDSCGEDSKFLFKQEDCYANFKAIKDCAKTYDNLDDFKKCTEKSMCIYCTDQYAGYADCLTKKTSDYSALYIYKNPTLQKDWQSTFFATIFGEKLTAPLYPESAKCPFFSQCPKCPCKDNKCTLEEKCLCCGADCGEYVYSGDPLTFYCRTSWEPEEAHAGRWWVCEKNNEIPVGQTVDNAEKWTDDLLSKAGSLVNKTESMIQYIQEIGNKNPSDYCHCDSKCASDSICSGDCIFNQWQEPDIDPDTGEPTGTFHWVCSCDIQPCSGKPCLEMINRLRGGTCPNGTSYPGVDWHYQGVKNAFEELKSFILEGGRSEILKTLVYSRKKMDQCSEETSSLGNIAVKPLSCTWAYTGTGILQKRCYGILEGLVRNPPESLMDNWFCCQKVVK